MKQHPLSSAFPAMPAEDFEALKDSISNIGVQNPITVFEGMVIDGWHRYTAANEVGAVCPTVDLVGVDPRDFVLAQNKARRHITQAQLAMAATAVHAWRPVGKPLINQGLSNSAGPAELAKTTKEIAKSAGVGVRSIEQAKAVQTKATAEVQEAVKRGEIGLEKASKIAQLPKEEQAAAIKKPAPKKEVEDEHYFGPSDEELEAAQASAASDMSSLMKLIDSDDKLATLAEENKRLRAENAVIASARDGYMNRCNELITRIKTLKSQLRKAEAAHV